MIQHPLDFRGKQHDRGQDSQPQRQQERPRQCPIRFFDLEAEGHFKGIRREERPDRIDQLLIDAEDERHCSARHARDHIRRPHDEPRQEDAPVFPDRPLFPFHFRHLKIPFCFLNSNH